jgi:hypothetical protein
MIKSLKKGENTEGGIFQLKNWKNQVKRLFL